MRKQVCCWRSKKIYIFAIAIAVIFVSAFLLYLPDTRNYLNSVVSAIKNKCQTVKTTTFIKSYRVKELTDTYGIAQTKDGKYVITGHTVNPNESMCGYSMFWIKADKNGSKEWSKLYNNCGSDGYAITQLTDGNYVAAGEVAGEFRTDEEQAELEGQGDNLVVKIDSKGNPIWTRTVSQQSIDTPAKLLPTKDGGFVMSGSTGKLTGQPDVADVMHIMFLGNFNTNGETNWLKEIDADEQFPVKFAEQTKDNGYILIGNIKLVDENNQNVPALVKLNKNGDYEWATGLESVPLEIPNLTMNPDKSLKVGTPNKMHLPFGTFFTAEQTNDGGYMALGNFYSASLSADELKELTKNAGKELSFVAVKVDQKGKFQWARTLKLKKYLEDPVIEKTKDGGYIIMGNVLAIENQQIAERAKAAEEMMNEYYKKYPIMSPETPASKKELEKISDTIEATNAPFEAKNIILVKTDANFKYQWGKKIGITKNLYGYDIIQTADSGYAIAGTWHTGIKYKSLGAWVEYTEAMIMKLDANGNLGNDNGLVADFSDTESSDVSSYIVANKLNSPKLLQSYPIDNIVRKIKVGDKKGINTIASEAKTYNVKFCSITAKSDTAGSAVATKTRPQMKYEETKEIEAATEKGKKVNNELMPILKGVFNNEVKLWDNDISGWVAYRFKRLVTKDDINKISAAMITLGYKIDSNANGDFTATKIGATLNFHFYLGDTNQGRLDVTY
ncbi:hypothetical protein HZA39_04410 [Candidatus Peregrinibacteria bacterium]|nr:hypothetical protein [Candidatus Peregrinibacteria bacterium]